MAPRRLSDMPQVHRILTRGVHVILECPRCDNQMMVLKTDSTNGPWRCQCLEQLGGIIMVPMEIPTELFFTINEHGTRDFSKALAATRPGTPERSAVVAAMNDDPFEAKVERAAISLSTGGGTEWNNPVEATRSAYRGMARRALRAAGMEE